MLLLLLIMIVSTIIIIVIIFILITIGFLKYQCKCNVDWDTITRNIKYLICLLACHVTINQYQRAGNVLVNSWNINWIYWSILQVNILHLRGLTDKNVWDPIDIWFHFSLVTKNMDQLCCYTDPNMVKEGIQRVAVKFTASWSVFMHNNPAWCSPSGAARTSRKVTPAKDLRVLLDSWWWEIRVCIQETSHSWC